MFDGFSYCSIRSLWQVLRKTVIFIFSCPVSCYAFRAGERPLSDEGMWSEDSFSGTSVAFSGGSCGGPLGNVAVGLRRAESRLPIRLGHRKSSGHDWGGLVLRPSEHPFRYWRRRFRGHFRGRQPLGFRRLFGTRVAHVVDSLRSPRGARRQVGSSRSRGRSPRLHDPAILGQPAFLKVTTPPIPEDEIAQSRQFPPAGFDAVRIGVEDARSPGRGIRARGRRFRATHRAYARRSAVRIAGQFDLAAEGFGLLLAEIAAP